MSAPSPTRRGGRLRRACDLCQQKKIRCDNGKPDCETCRDAGICCTVTRRSPPTRNSLKEQLVEAKARIRELEAQITAQEIRGKPGQGDASRLLPANLLAGYLQDPHDLDTSMTMFQRLIALCGIGANGSAERDSFCLVISQQTGSQFDVDQFLQGLPAASGIRGSRNSEKATSQQWPTRHLVQLCINQFIKTGLYSVFPVVNVKVLQMLLDEDILDLQAQSADIANLACLVSFTALITELHRLEPAFSNCDPDSYLRTVLALIPRLLVEEPTLRTLEAVIIVVTYLLPIGHTNTADFLLAIAIRIMYSLGANRYSVVRAAEGRHTRALFWLCYGVDKELAMRIGRPPLINDIDCDLQLPDNYILSDNLFVDRPLSPEQLLYTSDLRLAFIKSKICTLLYSDHGRAQSEARRLQYIRELDEELNALKSSYPDSCWPDVFATEESPDYTIHDLSLRGVNLHLEYYFCLGKIHGASSASILPSLQSWSFLPSSAELFYQESRTMLYYIARVRRFINWHTFWIHAQFILTAVISLFRHLITSPTAPMFSSDIQLLENIAETFSELDRESRATRRFAPFFFTTCFTRKLIFLAKQSLRKADGG
ncbi:Zn(II)2Cys6 transcription factor [Aspergillus undulatus]|uniref:Zn(II)2Cys6 transcription factor n=1 Tax=Aspergillus undulatus TaxID=1810928 RepID=UPI003CCE507E